MLELQAFLGDGRRIERFSQRLHAPSRSTRLAKLRACEISYTRLAGSTRRLRKMGKVSVTWPETEERCANTGRGRAWPARDHWTGQKDVQLKVPLRMTIALIQTSPTDYSRIQTRKNSRKTRRFATSRLHRIDTFVSSLRIFHCQTESHLALCCLNPKRTEGGCSQAGLPMKAGKVQSDDDLLRHRSMWIPCILLPYTHFGVDRNQRG